MNYPLYRVCLLATIVLSMCQSDLYASHATVSAPTPLSSFRISTCICEVYVAGAFQHCETLNYLPIF